MRVASSLFDSRINAKNVLIEISVKEYENLVQDILKKNEFQRKRVRSSKTIYALLKEDLLRQCVIPPIVLALTNDVGFDSDDEFNNILIKNKSHLVILDGLQRTHTIFDLLFELRTKDNQQDLNAVENTVLRVEIYIGLNRLGILYRMLTLNTGQTPMSLRQQIEMLYLDYLNKNIQGIELVRESEGRTANQQHQYNFKEVIEGFNSYLDRDELPIDKSDILENINSLEKLSKENQSSELFDKYIVAFDKFISRTIEICGNDKLSEEYINEHGIPFGINALQVFKKPQAMSGFGAALGKLIDFTIISDIDDVIIVIDAVNLDDGEDFLETINNSLLWIKNNSKKIGNAQRTFFAFYFRELFNSDTDGYGDLTKASSIAFRKYQAQNT